MPCWKTEFRLVLQMMRSAHCTTTMLAKKAVWQVNSTTLRCSYVYGRGGSRGGTVNVCHRGWGDKARSSWVRPVQMALGDLTSLPGRIEGQAVPQGHRLLVYLEAPLNLTARVKDCSFSWREGGKPWWAALFSVPPLRVKGISPPPLDRAGSQWP